MYFNIYAKKEDNNIIQYIMYENGRTIELARNYQYKIFNNNKNIFFMIDENLIKVFDINNKRFITDKFNMQILYNNYKELKRKKKKILKPNI